MGLDIIPTNKNTLAAVDGGDFPQITPNATTAGQPDGAVSPLQAAKSPINFKLAFSGLLILGAVFLAYKSWRK